MNSKREQKEPSGFSHVSRSLIFRLWRKLPDPKVHRISNSLIYISTLIGGGMAVFTLPPTLVSFIGVTMVVVLGLFSLAGSLIALFGILRGVGWIEQVGLILIFTALLMYTVALLAASGVAVGPWFAAGLAIGLARRWIHLRLTPHEEGEFHARVIR